MSSTDWFEVHHERDGITVIREPLGDEDIKSFLVEGERDVAVLDTGQAIGDFAGLVAGLSSKDPIVLHSHAHWDHIGDSHRFARVLIHPAEADALRAGMGNREFRAKITEEYFSDKPFPAGFDVATATIPGCEPTGMLNHGDVIDLGERMLEVFHTPGHSQGGVTLLDRANRALFPGDAMNFGAFYLFGPESDPAGFRATLSLLVQLVQLADDIYPSHGDWPMKPDDVRAIQSAYEEVWAGRAPDSHDVRGGEDSHVEIDVHEFGRFRFWIESGRYR
jgi:glyoxylase-like metal-dependent hydrolase (beta-lactamase superfamily II)